MMKNDDISKLIDSLAGLDPLSSEFQNRLAKIKDMERGASAPMNEINYQKEAADSQVETNEKTVQPKFEKMQSLAEAMETPIDNNGLNEYDLTAMDTAELTDLVQYVEAGSEEYQHLAKDLDQDLSMLHGAGQAKYDDVVKDGINSLHKADETARKKGAIVPERKIDMAMSYEHDNIVPKLSDAPEKSNGQDVEMEK